MVVIEVLVLKNGDEIARVKIENMSETHDVADYSVRFAAFTGASVAIYQRAIYAFPRRKINVLGLVRQALATLEEKELTLDGDPDTGTVPANLARQLRRAGR